VKQRLAIVAAVLVAGTVAPGCRKAPHDAIVGRWRVRATDVVAAGRTELTPAQVAGLYGSVELEVTREALRWNAFGGTTEERYTVASESPAIVTLSVGEGQKAAPRAIAIVDADTIRMPAPRAPSIELVLARVKK
jgi:hypothetical protein